MHKIQRTRDKERETTKEKPGKLDKQREPINERPQMKDNGAESTNG